MDEHFIEKLPILFMEEWYVHNKKTLHENQCGN